MSEERTLQNILNELQEREVDRLEAKVLELTEKVYPNLPEVIKRTAELTGTSEGILVRACVHAAWHYKDLEWHSVLDIVRSFCLARKNIEADELRQEAEENAQRDRWAKGVGDGTE